MSKQYILLSIALVAMLGVVGCNESNKTTAPVGDTVAPAAVQQLDGEVIDSQSPQVSLNWKAGAELDLEGYHVYRSVNGGTSELVATTSSARWNDKSVTKGQQYTYEVTAFDQAANESSRVSTGTMSVEGVVSTHGQDFN